MTTPFHEMLNCRVVVVLPGQESGSYFGSYLEGRLIDLFESNGSMAAVQWAKIAGDRGEFHLVNLCQVCSISKLERQHV